MRKLILFLVVCLFSAATVLSENFNQFQSTINSESTSLSVNQASEHCNEALVTESLSDSSKIDSAKVQILNSDTAKVVPSTVNQIIIKKCRYTLNGKKLNNKECRELLTSEPECAKEYKKARAQLTYEIITLVGLEIVLVATTGYYMGVLPCVLVTLPFGAAYNKHMKEAIRLYNLKHVGDIVRPTTIGNITKFETKIISPEVKTVATSTSNQLNVGDTVSFYSFQTNSTVIGTIIEIKDKTVVVQYNSFNKTYTSGQQVYDVKKVK
jgi:hypothetical protein